jgi:hypothetical protein
VLAEFYAVVTNPRRVTEAKSPEAVLEAITHLIAMPGLTLLPSPLDLVSRWTALLREHPVSGRKGLTSLISDFCLYSCGFLA